MQFARGVPALVFVRGEQTAGELAAEVSSYIFAVAISMSGSDPQSCRSGGERQSERRAAFGAILRPDASSVSLDDRA
jgi:hypothetical protein